MKTEHFQDITNTDWSSFKLQRLWPKISRNLMWRHRGVRHMAYHEQKIAKGLINIENSLMPVEWIYYLSENNAQSWIIVSLSFIALLSTPEEGQLNKSIRKYLCCAFFLSNIQPKDVRGVAWSSLTVNSCQHGHCHKSTEVYKTWRWLDSRFQTLFLSSHIWKDQLPKWRAVASLVAFQNCHKVTKTDDKFFGHGSQNLL